MHFCDQFLLCTTSPYLHRIRKRKKKELQALHPLTPIHKIGILKTLHFEVKTDIGDIVKRTLGQIKPHQLVGGRILVTDCARI